MAIQAQPNPNPSTNTGACSGLLADLTIHRPPPAPMPVPNNVDSCDFDPRTLFVTFPFVGQDMPSCQQQQNQHQHLQQVLHHQTLLQPGSGGFASTTVPNFAVFQQQQQQAITNIELPASRQRKRRIKVQTNIRKPSSDLNQSHHGCVLSGTLPPNTGVSTGLRLALDDDLSTVTSSRPDFHVDLLSTSGMMIFGEDMSLHAIQQHNELNQLIKMQTEQLRHSLLERMQMHSKVLLATVEEQVSHLLRGRDMELENVTQRNLELEQRIKQIGLETQIWQNKAKGFEAMVAMLRANLQQALVNQSREQNPVEGHGDNDADDAASEHIDGSDEAQKTRASMKVGRKMLSDFIRMNRACRSCRAMEASVLIVPCMHLCLCSNCQKDIEKCPICNSDRSACVEVYLS